MPAAEVDPQALRLWSSVNGEARQDSTTADMVFTVAQLVHHLSQYMVLEPGDLINTGTPPQGVALSGRFPYLQVGGRRGDRHRRPRRAASGVRRALLTGPARALVPDPQGSAPDVLRGGRLRDLVVERDHRTVDAGVAEADQILVHSAGGVSASSQSAAASYWSGSR